MRSTTKGVGKCNVRDEEGHDGLNSPLHEMRSNLHMEEPQMLSNVDGVGGDMEVG